MSEVIDVIIQSLRDILKRQPSEGLLWDNYGRLCLLIDEIVNEVSNSEPVRDSQGRGRGRILQGLLPTITLAKICFDAGMQP